MDEYNVLTMRNTVECLLRKDLADAYRIAFEIIAREGIYATKSLSSFTDTRDINVAAEVLSTDSDPCDLYVLSRDLNTSAEYLKKIAMALETVIKEHDFVCIKNDDVRIQSAERYFDNMQHRYRSDENILNSILETRQGTTWHNSVGFLIKK